MQKCEYEQVTEALHIWFTHHRDRGVPISRPIVQEKALTFRNEFHEGHLEFTASVCWLDRWKMVLWYPSALTYVGRNCHQMMFKEFKVKFLKFVESEKLTGDQTFNCDESGLNYKMLPKKPLAAKIELVAPLL